MLDWEEDDEGNGFSVSEALRQKLLKEEFKLRKKQPEAWTKTKYRKFALFNTGQKKPKPKIQIEEEHELEAKDAKKRQAKK